MCFLAKVSAKMSNEACFLRRWTLAARFAFALLLVAAGGALGVRSTTAAHRAHLSNDLAAHEQRHSAARTRVIVHGSHDEITALAARHQLQLARWLAEGAVLRANSAEISSLAADPDVDHLSGDPLVTPAMSISNASTAADQTRAGSAGLRDIGSIPGVNGQGVVVAVVDSGIAPHQAIAKRVIAKVSVVTGDPSTADAYGHGTHVAGIIAGSAGPATLVTSQYNGGIAPGVQLVNVRVLGATGAGYTSDAIAGLDWVIANRTRYNIRIVNLSIGHPVTEPAATDPLCEAVARATGAGLLVVTAAGNAGRTLEGHHELGGITSPGNSPFALTVGAINTWNTIARRDDTVAEFSSRGPTKYDLAVKPDVAAPGTRIISLEADNSYLSTHYPYLHIAGGGNNAYMRLSGTSMAAPIGSGAAALLLQGAPGLSPAQVKLALQSGATYMQDGGLVGAGAGSIDIWASRKITVNGLSSLTSVLIGGALTPPSGASFWDAGTMSSRIYEGTGIRLLSTLDAARVWSNPSLLNYGDLNLVGLLIPLGWMAPNPLIWGEAATWTRATNDDAIVWGTAMYDDNGDAIVWGTSDNDDAIVWGTGSMTAGDPR